MNRVSVLKNHPGTSHCEVERVSDTTANRCGEGGFKGNKGKNTLKLAIYGSRGANKVKKALIYRKIRGEKDFGGNYG